MHTPLQCRPNLKMFVLLAIVVLALKEWDAPDEPERVGPALTGHQLSSAQWPQTELAQLEALALETPSAQLYFLISEQYKMRGALERAMYYLRKGGLAAEIEERLH